MSDPEEVARELLRRNPLPEFDDHTLVLLRKVFNQPPEKKPRRTKTTEREEEA